jgi:hypothetical protein
MERLHGTLSTSAQRRIFEEWIDQPWQLAEPATADKFAMGLANASENSVNTLAWATLTASMKSVFIIR